jgi:DNA modification methylase
MGKYKFNKTYLKNSDIMLEELVDSGYKFDLILTDPPYNIGKDFGSKSNSLEINEFLKITKKRIKLLKRLLNKNGSIIWFGIHDYIGLIQNIMYELDLNYRRMIIWHYNNGFSRSKRYPSNTYEPVLWFSKSKNNWIYNVDKLRVPYKSKRVKSPVYYTDSKGNKKAWTPNPKGAMRGDIWECPTLSGKNYKDERTDHPTQKPEKLITDFIKGFCPTDENDKLIGKILDPFHGSGTVGVCAEKLNEMDNNIKWMGIEIEEKWNNVAKKRIREINKNSEKKVVENDKETLFS